MVLIAAIVVLRRSGNEPVQVPVTADEARVPPQPTNDQPVPPVAPPPIARPVEALAQPNAPAPAAARAPVPRTTELTEADIMAKINELGSSDPAQTLKLARDGNRRFRQSADAPQRASHIVRALLNLDRREEARAEALKMEKEYPGSPWTDDVHRHMFVNPPTHPTERGYGKTKELE